MWTTSPLRLSLSRPAATLADAISQGLLNSTCGTGTGCAASARWELGKWGTCSKRCDSGTRTRTADCIQTSSGALSACWATPRGVGSCLQVVSSLTIVWVLVQQHAMQSVATFGMLADAPP
jgi:hypothetical protein